MSNDQYEKAVAASIHKFDFHADRRGSLFVQDLTNFPVHFVRLFILEGIKKGSIRGEHAHKECWLFVFASGSGIDLNIKNTSGCDQFSLNRSMGVLIPPYNWTQVHFKEKNSMLYVLASQPYNPNDYIYSEPIPEA